MRAIAFHGGDESFPAGYIVSWFEHIDPCAGTLNNVGQAEPPIWKTPIVLVCEWLKHELRLEQEFPESVGVPGKVMSGGS